MDILITEQAYDEIFEATETGHEEGRECGGSLLAHERDGVVLLAYALPTGPDARAGHAHLRTDAAFQNDTIARVRGRYPGLCYAGDWHVHPMWLPQLSATDRRTCAAILQCEAAHRDHLVLVLGSVQPSGTPVLLGFVAHRQGQKDVDVREVALRVVDSDSAEVRAHLGQPLLPLDEVLAAAPEPQPVTHHAAKRIERDLADLRRRLGADAALYADDEHLFARVRRGAREAVVLFPPEYPVGAPQIFSGPLRTGPLRPVPLRFAWSSCHCLTDPVGEALAAAGSPLRLLLGAALLLRRSLGWLLEVIP